MSINNKKPYIYTMQNVITETAMVHLAMKIDANLFDACGIKQLSYDTANDMVANWLIENNVEVI